MFPSSELLTSDVIEHWIVEPISSYNRDSVCRLNPAFADAILYDLLICFGIACLAFKRFKQSPALFLCNPKRIKH